MPLETNDPSLNAAQLVGKHRVATTRYGCQEIVKLMKEHKISLEELTAHLGEPSKAEKLQELKAKLFQVKEDGVLRPGSNAAADSAEPSSGEAQAESESPGKAPAKTVRKTIPAKAK